MESIPRRIQQAAAIPVKDGKICLITSRSGKRWVIPKGCLEPGKTVEDIALQEAWEEAGLSGVLHAQPVGSYLYEKWDDTYQVTVFMMDVTAVADEWPERSLRERCWLTPARALAQLTDAGLRKVLRGTLEIAATRQRA